MRRRDTILFLVLVGLFLTPGLGSADWIPVVPEATYTFLDEMGDYGAYVTVEVLAEEDPSSPFSDGVGTFYRYKYIYQVDNTGPTGTDTFYPILDIAWLRFTGAEYIEYGTNETGGVDVSLGDDSPESGYGLFQFDFNVADDGLQAGEITDEFWITSWFSNAELSSIFFPPAVLQDGGQTAFGNITSDLLVPSGSALSNPAPEPSTLLLLGSGLLTAACLRRYRKKK